MENTLRSNRTYFQQLVEVLLILIKQLRALVLELSALEHLALKQIAADSELDLHDHQVLFKERLPEHLLLDQTQALVEEPVLQGFVLECADLIEHTHLIFY